MILKNTNIMNFGKILLIIGVIFSANTNLSAQGVDCIKINKNIRIYNTGVEVTNLQKFLTNKTYLKSPITGYFGFLTEKAVMNYQKVNNLPSTGIVGPLTRKLIEDQTCVQTINIEKPIQTPEPVTIETPIIKKLTLPYTTSDFSDWKVSWGKLTNNEQYKTLRATETTNGAQVVLPHSEDWINYKINANIFVRQATVTLLARYVDDNNFLGCSFSGRYIEIIQKVNGVTEVVAFTSISDIPQANFFYDDLNLSVRVKGNTIGCTLVGAEDNVSFTKINSALLKGGIGVQTFVNGLNIASIDLKSLKVTEEN